MTSRIESELLYGKGAEVTSKIGLVNNIRKAVKLIRIASISNTSSYGVAGQTDNSETGNRWMRAETLTLKRIQMLQ